MERVCFVKEKIAVLAINLDRKVRKLISRPVGGEDGRVEIFDGRFFRRSCFNCGQLRVDELPGRSIVLVGGVVHKAEQNLKALHRQTQVIQVVDQATVTGIQLDQFVVERPEHIGFS